MAKITDSEGKEIEVFTRAEVEQIVSDSISKVKQELPPAFDETKLTGLTARLDSLDGFVSQSRVKELGTPFVGSDKEKLKSFTESFNRLSGYEDTEEGQSLRAAAAARLAFGSDVGIDTAGLSAGGGKSVDASGAPIVSPADKAIQEALGITSADVTKFGNK